MKTRAELDRDIARAEAKLPAARARLMKIPGVERVEIGIKLIAGMATGDVAFHVFVTRKIRESDVPPAQRIPPVIDDVPTDVIEITAIRQETDVLWGGVSATTGFMGGSMGTLGAIALATAANTVTTAGTPVLVTNNHVAGTIGEDVGNGCKCSCWCCECGVVARVIDTRATPALDATIAVLLEGVPWSHAITGLGAVTGMAPANVGDIVYKYGQTTGLTKGMVSTLTYNSLPGRAAFTNQILVSPSAPTNDVSSPGDSGSVYLNAETRRVVGLHHGAPSGALNTSGVACHMTQVGGGGVADVLNIDFPNMGTAGATPISGVPEPELRPSMLREVLALSRDLERSESGQRWLDLLRQHAPEVKHLVNHHRATQVAWQRSQGPAFIAHFLKSARDAAHRVPLEIAGMRAENTVLTMAAVLQEHASAELSRAISEHYLTALQCMQRAESTESLLRNATQLAGVNRGK